MMPRHNDLLKLILMAALIVLALGVSAWGAAWRNPRTGASFDNDVAAFGKADQTNPPPLNAILFLGASSMRLWRTLAEDLPEYRVINRGFGGSQISDVIHYMDRVVLPYSPAVIVFYPGADDTETVLPDFKAFVTNVHSRLPTTHIAFMSLLAKPANSAGVDRVRDANRLIKEFAVTQPGLSFIDVFSEMVGPEGQPRAEFFREDGLHTNERGYALWTKLIRKHLAGIDAASAARKGPAIKKPTEQQEPEKQRAHLEREAEGNYAKGMRELDKRDWDPGLPHGGERNNQSARL